MKSKIKDSLLFILFGLCLIPFIVFIPSLWHMAGQSNNSKVAQIYLFLCIVIIIALPIGLASIYLGIKNLIRR